MNGIKIVWRTAGTAAALVALALLAAGCIEEMRQGGRVSFTASTSYLNGAVKGQTKTLYSSDRANSGYERINWVTGDLVKIYCEQSLGQESDPTKKSAVYTVTAANSHSGASDKAEAISPRSPDTHLSWNVSGGMHHYFATYPSDVTIEYYDNNPSLTDVRVLKHSVPEVQFVSGIESNQSVKTSTGTTRTVTEFVPDMRLVTMGAYSAKAPDTFDPTVSLKFRPLVTSLRVELLAKDDLSKSENLTMLRLVSIPGPGQPLLAGTYRVAVGDYENNKTSGRAFSGANVDVDNNVAFKTIGVNPPAGATENAIRIMPQTAGPAFASGVRLSETKATAFTFVMPPVAAKYLTLELTFGGTYDAASQTVSGGTTRSLRLEDNNQPWTLGERRKNYLDLVSVNIGAGNLALSANNMWVGDAAQTVTATATDGSGNPVSNPVISNWKSSNQGVATVNGSGQITAVNTGFTYISATWTYNGTTKNDTVMVTVNKLTGVTVTPQTVNLNGTVTMPYEVTYRKGGLVNTTEKTNNVSSIGCSMTWSSANGTNASVTNAGLATGKVAGTTTALTVTVTRGTGSTAHSVTGSGDLTVNAGAGNLALSANNMWVGDAAQTVTVTATDGSGNPVSNPVISNWKSSNPSVATVNDNGQITAVNTGFTNISATWTYNGTTKNDTVMVTVNKLTGVTVTPQTVNLNGTVTMPYEVTYRKGGLVNTTETTNDVSSIGCSMTWSSANGTNASVTNAGLATGRVAGTTTALTVTVTRGTGSTAHSVSGSGDLKVNAGAGNLALSANNMWVGDAAQTVTATATDGSGNPVSSPALSNWQSSDPTVATVSNGQVTALKAGTTTISATWTYNGTTKDGQVTVTVSQLKSVAVTPQTVNLNGTVTMPYEVTYQEGATMKMTNNVSSIGCTMTWSSANSTNAFVTNAGLATGKVAGTTTALTVTVTRGTGSTAHSVTGSGDLTVNAGAGSLALSANNMWVGDAAQTVTATATDGSGNPVSSPALSNWQSSDPTVATVSNGQVTALKAGTTIISATWTYNGTTKDGQVTVTVSQLTGVTVTSQTVNLNGTVTMPYEVTYKEGATMKTTNDVSSIGCSMTWSSANGTNASVTNAGLATGKVAGTTTALTVTVTRGTGSTAHSVSGSGDLKVNAFATTGTEGYGQGTGGVF